MPTDNAYPSRGPAASGIEQRPSARERGRMRRRLREQRRMREALLLDLGALVFELHRQGRRAPELLQAKAAELSAVDQEVRALSYALDSGQTVHELVVAGVAGSCSSCGSLLSTDARYCAACGAPAVPGLDAGQGRPQGTALQPASPYEEHASPGVPQDPSHGGALDRFRARLARRNTGD